ncbi:MAG: DUF58 domain-containing protein [Planctomycetes bacterium]|nr:DUF58 domain-containing protein [Planctomycetota bacterium]
MTRDPNKARNSAAASSLRGPARRIGRRYHMHMAGVLYVATTIVLVLGALNGQNNLLFAIFGLAVGGLLVSGVLSGANLLGISVERLPTPPTAVGEPLVVRYRVRNRNRLLSSLAITIEELPAVRRRGETQPRLHSPVLAFAAHVPARGEVIVEATATTLRRGVATLSRFRAISTFPFGLTKKSVVFEQPEAITIRPRIAPVRREAIEAGGGAGERGGRARRWRGGEEFWALREFLPGDSLRTVAWRPSARHGSVLVRDTARAATEKLIVELDTSGADADQIEHAVSVAGGVASVALGAGRAVGLRDRGGTLLAPVRSGRGSLADILDALAVWIPGAAPLRQGEPDDASHRGSRPRVIIVTAVPKHDSEAISAQDSAIVEPGFSPFGREPKRNPEESL